MSIGRELIYSKRYPENQEEPDKILAEDPLPDASKEKLNESFQELCRLMSEEKLYEPSTKLEAKSREFISLAKALSEQYEIDMDINRTTYSVEVSLHLYCAAYSKDMTRKFSKLFDLCDKFASYTPKTEPSDFTLVLELHTHTIS